MSRMLAFIGEQPLSLTEAVGQRRAQQFADLSALHSDGWGTAWLADPSTLSRRVAVGRWDDAANAEAEKSTKARLLYLRFASRDSALGPENIQPFAQGGVAFQHNGALPDPELARDLLLPSTRSGLRGSSDSELYFALMVQHLGGSTLADDVRESAGIAATKLRSLFADACLNAFILTADALIVVQSAGSAGLPLAAFAARGFLEDTLPPGHDDRYNRLAWKRSPRTGTVVVATTGITTDGWTTLPDDSVSWFTSDEADLGTVPLSNSARL